MSGKLPRVAGVWIILVAVGGVIAGEMMVRSVYREFHLCGRLLQLVSVGIALLGLCLLFRKRLVSEIAWFVAGILAIMAIFPILELVQGPRYPRGICKENLSQIGKAIRAYTQNNEGYMPYDERGPLHSLTLLYPDYFLSAEPFQCPYVRTSWAKRHMGTQFPADTALSGERCHYGYTWRCAPDSPSDFAIAADMPENHAEQEGYNVLYSDGAIKWQKTPFCSHDPNDNIFAREPGWSADTDSFIRLE